MAARSQLRRAIATPANRTALAIALAIAAAVVALSRIPAAPGLELDLRSDPPRFGWTTVRLVGFGDAGDAGRAIEGDARLVFSRPLPPALTLSLDAGAARPGTRLAVSLADQREVVTLSGRGPAHVRLTNAAGARAIGLRALGTHEAPRIRRVAVR